MRDPNLSQPAAVIPVWVLLAMLLLLPMRLAAAPDGAALYAKYCAVCHGDTGDGGVGVPLSLPSFLNDVDDDYLRRTIRHGRPGRIMPAFGRLSDAQLNALVGHLRSWSDAPAPVRDETPVRGDSEHGGRLFASYCAQCHGEQGAGGLGTGVTFSRSRELPIIAPALNNPEFQRAATDAMIKDTLLYGREGTPMTSMLVQGLTERDIDDLVAYIRTLKSDHHAAAVKEIDPILEVESPYDFDQTVENVKAVIEGNNFRFIRQQLLEEGLAPKGEENPRKMMIYFCNFKFLFDALAIDPRIGMFLPCRITVVEHEGKVSVMAINPLRLSYLFNNDELSESCETMHGIYEELLEDATL